MAQQAVAAPGRLAVFSSLRYRDFRLLWLGVLFTSSGQWMEQVAMGWLILELTDSPFMLGAKMFFRSIPLLFFGSIGGVAADRIDRKKMMIIGQIAIMVIIFVLAVLTVTGLVNIWHVFIASFLTGTAWSFMIPVRQAMVPDLVEKKDLMNAIALNSAAFQMTRILGPAVAGFLVGMVGVGGAFFVQTAAYTLVILFVVLMRIPDTLSSARHSSMWHNLREGFQYVGKNRNVLALLLLALFPMIFGMPYTSIMPVFARDVLDIGASGLGILMAAPGIGALAAALTLAGLKNFKRKGLLLLVGATMFGVTLIAFALTSWLPLALVFLVFVGLSNVSFMATNNTLLQTIVPNEVRGRVMGIYSLDMGLVPFGGLIAGSMASLFGAPAALAIMGAVLAIFVIIIGIKVPSIRQLE